jgi:hypothetical protein
MGIEYQEFVVKIKNKHTGKTFQFGSRIPHKYGVPLMRTHDFEIIDFKILHG